MGSHDDNRRNRGTWAGGFSALALAGVLTVTACSSGSGTSAGAGNAASATSAASGATGSQDSSAATRAGCGTYPQTMPSDPDGVLAKLPATLSRYYAGYSTAVHMSPWADWKPKSGLVVGISWGEPVNDFAADTLATIKSGIAAIPGVSKVVVLAGAGPSDIPGQLQQYQSLVQQKVNLIVADVSVGAPFVSAVNAAAKAGIPTISALDTIPTASAVNVVPANYAANAQTMAAEMNAIHDKGTVLEVHGIPGISIDSDAFRAFSDVLARCRTSRSPAP